MIHQKVIEYENPGPFESGDVIAFSSFFSGVAIGPTEEGITPVCVRGLVNTKKNPVANLTQGQSVVNSSGVVAAGTNNVIGYTYEEKLAGTDTVRVLLR